MAQSRETAPPAPDSDNSSPPAPPTSDDSSSSSAPPPDESSSPSPPTSPPPRLADDQSPSPEEPSPPPPMESSPPPPSPPPSNGDNSSSSSSSPPPPPPPPKSPPSSSNDSPSPPPPSDRSFPSFPPQQHMAPPSPPSSKHLPPSHSGELPSPTQPAKSSPIHTPPSHSEAKITDAPPNHGTDINIPLIVGVTAGVGLFFIILAVMFLCCCCKKKKKHHDHGMNYYTNPSRHGSHRPKDVDYYSNATPPTWGAPPMDHIVKVPPPPGWHGPPPPPPMMSSEMSSAYSGPHGPALPPPSPNIALGFNKSTFSYDELAAATSGFSQANLLGQGGFGYVHKGVLPNGKEIAVKSLKSGSGQGEREFQAEVEIISRVHHRHLVSLVGYCIAGGQRMLVYEFVPNNTLEYHLHGSGRPTMDFPTRLKIALGSAKGLAYLHEDCHPRIIHRDIKAANILLDHKFEAMVADFGLAKLSTDNHTHVSTRVMGTFGYLAPEYASSGKLSEKSDVFSFGVMLLELITGRQPVDTTQTMMEDSLVEWARPLMGRALADGNFEGLADPKLGNNYNPSEMACLVACAAAGVRHSARRRPKMSQIVRALEGDSSLEDLNDGVKPGQSSVFGSSDSSEYDSISYNSQMRKFRIVAMGSEEFGSSEYGATGEYGCHPSSSSSRGENSSEMKTNANQRQRL